MSKSSCLRSVALCCLGVALAAPAAQASRTQSQSTLVALDASVLVQLNLVRSEHQLAPLEASPELAASAHAHTAEMASDGYFAHASRNGAPFWKRVLEFYPQLPGKSWSAGENLLWTSGNLDAAQAVSDWMASPEHRANILDPQWRQVGISSIDQIHATGVYGGLNVEILTTDFGIRA
jgi:uncharacterized protein YkwD